MLRRFTLEEPESVNEVPSLLSKYGDDGAILAGGTELLLVMKQGMVRYEHLINIKKIPGLEKFDYDEKEGKLFVGPLVTHRDLEGSDLIKEKFPVIVEMERQIGNVRVRNMGTLAGNLCFAEHRSDVGTLLMGLKARVKAIGSNGERELGLEDFFVDFYETALEEDELVTEIQIPILPRNSVGTYQRFALSEWPTVGVAVILTFEPNADEGIKDAIITLGSVNPTPMRARKAEEAIKGKAVNEVLANLEQIGDIASKESNPLDDIHASEWYKRERLKVMVKRGIQECYNRWSNKERE
jgi:carbon-monoxide dehydrogenase medium subunit